MKKSEFMKLLQENAIDKYVGDMDSYSFPGVENITYRGAGGSPMATKLNSSELDALSKKIFDPGADNVTKASFMEAGEDEFLKHLFQDIDHGYGYESSMSYGMFEGDGLEALSDEFSMSQPEFNNGGDIRMEAFLKDAESAPSQDSILVAETGSNDLDYLLENMDLPSYEIEDVNMNMNEDATPERNSKIKDVSQKMFTENTSIKDVSVESEETFNENIQESSDIESIANLLKEMDEMDDKIDMILETDTFDNYSSDDSDIFVNSNIMTESEIMDEDASDIFSLLEMDEEKSEVEDNMKEDDDEDEDEDDDEDEDFEKDDEDEDDK